MAVLKFKTSKATSRAISYILTKQKTTAGDVSESGTWVQFQRSRWLNKTYLTRSKILGISVKLENNKYLNNKKSPIPVFLVLLSNIL